MLPGRGLQPFDSPYQLHIAEQQTDASCVLAMITVISKPVSADAVQKILGCIHLSEAILLRGCAFNVHIRTVSKSIHGLAFCRFLWKQLVVD